MSKNNRNLSEEKEMEKIEKALEHTKKNLPSREEQERNEKAADAVSLSGTKEVSVKERKGFSRKKISIE